MVDDFEVIPDPPASENSLFWNPLKNPNDPKTVEGEVVESKEGKYGRDLVLNTAGGKKQTPSHKNLQAKLAKVNVGQYIRITLTGEKSTGKGSKMQVYDVLVRKGYQASITQPPAPAAPAPINPQAQNGVAIELVMDAVAIELRRLESIYGGKVPESQCIGACQRTIQVLNVPYAVDNVWAVMKGGGRVAVAAKDAGGDYYKAV